MIVPIMMSGGSNPDLFAAGIVGIFLILSIIFLLYALTARYIFKAEGDWEFMASATFGIMAVGMAIMFYLMNLMFHLFEKFHLFGA